MTGLTAHELFDRGDYREAAELAFSIGAEDADALAQLLSDRWTEKSLSHEGLREALPDVWMLNYRPAAALGEDRWLNLFNDAGYLYRVTDDDDGVIVVPPPGYEPANFLTQPTRMLSLWRGSSIASAGRGFSWTSCRERALAFAQGWMEATGGRFGVYSAEVPGQALLAYFFTGREEEFVVDPTALGGKIVFDVEVDANSI